MDIASYNIAKVVYEQQYDKGESSFSLAREFGIELKQVHIDEEVIQLGIDRVQAEKHVIFGVRDRIKKFLCSWCS
jgi:deoxycytidylate deaminase